MKKKNNHKGMTLIEIIIAMAVLTIIALIMLAVYTSVATIVGNSRRQTIDNYSDQATVEEAIAEGVDSGTAEIQFVFTDGTDNVTVTINGQVINEGEIDIFIPAMDTN